MSSNILFGSIALIFALGGSDAIATSQIEPASMNTQGTGGAFVFVPTSMPEGVVIPLAAGGSHVGLTDKFAGSI